MRHNKINFFILIFVAIMSYWFINVKAKEAMEEIETVGSGQHIFDAKKLNKLVVMTFPGKGDSIESPVKISGSISGRWFFDGTLIGRITDTEGNILGQGPLIAENDWTTEKNVNFEGIIPFSTSNSKEGYVIVDIDNSGSSGDIPTYKIPISFTGDETSFCNGERCGAVMCNTGSAGGSGVCVHDSGVKNL